MQLVGLDGARVPADGTPWAFTATFTNNAGVALPSLETVFAIGPANGDNTHGSPTLAYEVPGSSTWKALDQQWIDGLPGYWLSGLTGYGAFAAHASFTLHLRMTFPTGFLPVEVAFVANATDTSCSGSPVLGHGQAPFDVVPAGTRPTPSASSTPTQTTAPPVAVSSSPVIMATATPTVVGTYTTQSGNLAHTGADGVTTYVGAAAVLVLGGVALIVWTRRRRGLHQG